MKINNYPIIRIYTKISGKEKRVVTVSEGSKITGWSRQYILKLIITGVLRAIRLETNIFLIFVDELKIIKLKERKK